MIQYRADSNFRNNQIVNNKYLDISEEIVTNKQQVQTKTITVAPKYDQRPDVLANDLYSNAKLWWVFAEFNQDSLIDPILDLRAGMDLVVPEKFS
tara:strand:+ start:1507 stop:1791 length:285 start_codon:yes stop_codon:yes gene_type:complete